MDNCAEESIYIFHRIGITTIDIYPFVYFDFCVGTNEKAIHQNIHRCIYKREEAAVATAAAAVE